MSLTTGQWKQMWDSVKNLERIAKELETQRTGLARRHALSDRIMMEVEIMKGKIQSVIGEME